MTQIVGSDVSLGMFIRRHSLAKWRLSVELTGITCFESLPLTRLLIFI